MDNSNMKNMVILKNLPSNLVEEAIVIFKTNNKIKKLELIDNKKQRSSFGKDTFNIKKDDFFIKEAENVISDYISRLENQNFKGKERLKKIENKYTKLKFISGILVGFCIICLSLIIF